MIRYLFFYPDPCLFIFVFRSKHSNGGWTTFCYTSPIGWQIFWSAGLAADGWFESNPSRTVVREEYGFRTIRRSCTPMSTAMLETWRSSRAVKMASISEWRFMRNSSTRLKFGLLITATLDCIETTLREDPFNASSASLPLLSDSHQNSRRMDPGRRDEIRKWCQNTKQRLSLKELRTESIVSDWRTVMMMAAMLKF